MQAFGREHPLALTVGALEEITALCPDGDIQKLGNILNGSSNDVMEFFVSFLSALSKGAEAQRKFQALASGEDYVPAPLTPEMLRALPPSEFKAAQAEALRVWKADKGTSVEAEPAKKNEEPAALAASS